jgi:peptide/nickel transport system substrate-binding protein
MYDAVTVVDEKGDVQPALAQSWKINSPTEWRFELRPNLKFDNGEPVDAAAVAWVINYLRKTQEGQATSASRTIDLVTGAEALSPTTVAVTTSRPDVILPSKISAIFMVAPKLWQEIGPGGYSAKPVGSGAFKVVAWQPERVQFVARTDSWRKAKVPGMETIALEERTARVQALLSNQIHFAPELSIDNVAQVEHAGNPVYRRGS